MSAPDLETLTHANIVDFIEDIFERCGSEEYLGEPVTMAEHMLQGAELAEQTGASDEIIAAALLHDIGHFTHEFPMDAADRGIDSVHEDAGARVLARFFPKIVVDCVRYHVAAKRYLCAIDPDYFSGLSPASVHSLELQGGPMSAEEAAQFSDVGDVEAICQVRVWDDLGKVAGHVTPPFAHYKPVLERIVAAQGALT